MEDIKASVRALRFAVEYMDIKCTEQSEYLGSLGDKYPGPRGIPDREKQIALEGLQHACVRRLEYELKGKVGCDAHDEDTVNKEVKRSSGLPQSTVAQSQYLPTEAPRRSKVCVGFEEGRRIAAAVCNAETREIGTWESRPGERRTDDLARGLEERGRGAISAAGSSTNIDSRSSGVGLCGKRRRKACCACCHEFEKSERILSVQEFVEGVGRELGGRHSLP
ncbi:hypothetical protein FB451DRAFT_1180552 [Mycena latifolia]|nr:hypothetical protein FB451DRAFT_1180552 [Mycena latifolia]